MSRSGEKSGRKRRVDSKGALAHKKPAQNPAPEPRVLSPNGGAKLVPGNPGNSGGKKGRSGRPKKEWGAFCLSALRNEETQHEIQRRLRDPKAREFAALVKVVAAYGVGEPPKRVRLTGLLAVADKLQGKSLEELRAMENLTVEELLQMFEDEDLTEDQEEQAQ